MSSLLTFQLRQQQQQQQHKHQESQSGIPSPPNSFCGEEQNPIAKVERRDSLQTVFNDMCIRDYPASLPDNYTIEHSAVQRKASHGISTATAAATGGLTIRNNRRQSDTFKRKTRGLSESYNNNGQYRCNDCGKSYKHPNCLQKHRWEHSEEWELTKSLPLTKHQQVQMLEAAAILIGMDRREKVLSRQEVEEVSEEEEIDVFRVDEEDENDDESIIIDDDEESKSLHSQEIFMDDI
ncbi:hypothetical protein CU098_000537 [Rhizopus stolonifer]|uniref:C2H2-type domain-containing protein n=1 Tax=Rhizopus stolonifer TaxID=4846 RepID=A0A367KT56_RHIST|nr:hypothetical protein CU098_000537 [Rhizopus stolonifer]